MQLKSSQLSQIWSLILESLQNIDVGKLVDGELFGTLLQAYLAAEENTRQSIYSRMLSMAETIAKDKTQPRRIGQVLSNFIFQTLANVTQ